MKRFLNFQFTKVSVMVMIFESFWWRCWQLCVGDFMMVKVLSSCRQKDYFCGFFHFGNFNVINWKLTSWFGYQHIKLVNNTKCLQQGYIDVGDKWMLVTLSWWQFLDVSDRISILVTSFWCWWPTPMFKDSLS